RARPPQAGRRASRRAPPNNLPPDPPPALTAAELRRRLLASTPPPIAATASDAEADDSPVGWTGPASDLIAKLRTPPARNGLGRVPEPPVEPVQPSPNPTPRSVPLNRRTPMPPRGASADPTSAIPGALNQLAGLGEGSGRMPVDASPMAEIQRLRGENRELRSLLEEMKHLLQEASDAEQQYTAKEKDYAAALAAKNAQIEELSSQLGAI